MLFNFAVFAALLQASPPDLGELKSQFKHKPAELAQHYYQHSALPANTGSAQFYLLTLRAAIVSNQPKLANEIALKLSMPKWQTYIANQHAKLVSNLGVLLRINGHYDKAIDAYECALALNQSDNNFKFHTLLNLQSAMVLAKQFNHAKQVLNQAQHLAQTKQQSLRVMMNHANHLLDTNQLLDARKLFKQLYRDYSLAGETEMAARVGLNLLNTEILLGDFAQFWRFQNTVRQSIFATSGGNHHYFYHFVIMRSLVNAMQAPSEVQYRRFAHAIARGDFLFEHGQKESMQHYVDMINIPWISDQFAAQTKEYERIRPKKAVPLDLLTQHCQIQ